MSFKDELRATIRTPEQVRREKENTSVDIGKYCANKDYEEWKKEIIHNAKNGKYDSEEGKKCIKADVTHLQISFYIKFREARFEYGFGNAKYERGIKYYIEDEVAFSTYKKEINRLAMDDDAYVQLKGKYIDEGKTYYFDIPGTVEKMRHYIDPRLMSMNIDIVLTGYIFI